MTSGEPGGPGAAEQADALYNGWLLDVPKLMDVAVLYGGANGELVRRFMRQARACAWPVEPRRAEVGVLARACAGQARSKRVKLRVWGLVAQAAGARLRSPTAARRAECAFGTGQAELQRFMRHIQHVCPVAPCCMAGKVLAGLVEEAPLQIRRSSNKTCLTEHLAQCGPCQRQALLSDSGCQAANAGRQQCKI